MGPPGLALVFALLLALGHADAYNFVQEYAGSTFFNGWNFYGSWDNLTLGDVNWVDAADAWSNGLVYINSAGHAVIRVDNSAYVPFNSKRNAVRITTQDFYNIGSLWTFDVGHIPWGCGVWPAIWSLGLDWPLGGEIDIIEGVNLMTENQIALHTAPGCMHDPAALQTATSGEMDCSTPAGCVVDQFNSTSFGDAFANAGGGVWAVQFDIEGIFIWFWSRSDVPTEIYSPAGSPLDISSWGTPTASFPATTCDILSSFSAQQIVIDTTLCGDWAGLPDVYASTCAGVSTATGAPPSGVCYLDNVIGPGSPKFDDAYWEIVSMRIFTTGSNGGPTQVADAILASSTAEVTAAPAEGSVNAGPRVCVPVWAVLVSLFLGLSAL